MPNANEVRLFILSRFAEKLANKGLKPENVPDDFDLLEQGIIDSMGVLDIVSSVEDRFATQLDLEDLPAEQLTVIGPLSEFIAASK